MKAGTGSACDGLFVKFQFGWPIHHQVDPRESNTSKTVKIKTDTTVDTKKAALLATTEADGEAVCI